MSSVPESASGRSSSLKGQANQSQYQALLFRHGIGIADLPTERRLKDAEGLVTTGGPGSGVTTDEEMAGWIDLLYCANLASHMPDFWGHRSLMIAKPSNPDPLLKTLCEILHKFRSVDSDLDEENAWTDHVTAFLRAVFPPSKANVSTWVVHYYPMLPPCSSFLADLFLSAVLTTRTPSLPHSCTIYPLRCE